jgi:hypothetical protein
MAKSSPFPGMNPFLENPEFWHDFHQSFVIYLRNAIGAVLSDAYFAKLEDQIYVHEVPTETRTLIGRADVSISLRDENRPLPAGNVAVVDPPPLQLELLSTVSDVERESFIEIRDRNSQRLVTVIEVLSPANKNPGKDREQYLYKRTTLLESQVHLVEIDLLRRGPRMPVKQLPACDYCLLVCQFEERPIARVWPFQVTDSFPPLNVPLHHDDPPVKINLGEVFQRVFVDSNYAKVIYKDLDPPLNAELAAWANALAKQ